MMDYEKKIAQRLIELRARKKALLKESKGAVNVTAVVDRGKKLEEVGYRISELESLQFT